MKKKIFGLLIMLITMILAMSGMTMAKTCSRCTNTLVESYRQIDSSQHFLDYDCPDAGCGYAETYRESHSFGSWKNNGAWTTHTKTCSKCKYSVSEDHTYNNGGGDNEKYFRANGSDECWGWKCTVCSSTTSANGHSWNAGEVVTAATCTSAGTMKYTCNNKSSHTKTETISKIDHNYTGACSKCGTTGIICSMCGAEKAHDCHTHDFTYKPATCTTPAECQCGETSGFALNHDYNETTRTAATCASTGTIYYECSRCGSTKTEPIPKLDHTWGTVYTASGSSGCYNKCTVCSTSNSTSPHVSASASGVYPYYNDSQHYQKCSRCNYNINHTNHTLTTTVTKDATCTTSGSSTTSCSACSYSKTSTIPALSHNYGLYSANGSSGHRRQCTRCLEYEITVPHTYTTSLVLSLTGDTYHCYRCTVCLYEKDVATHTLTVKNYTYDTAAGKYVHTRWCNVCKVYELSPENCTFTSKVTKNASCIADGNRRYTCSVCGQYYDEVIDKIEHNWSEWQTSRTEHWISCTYNCGNEHSRGQHVDSAPKDGYCDTCNYLMYITPKINISSDVIVKEDQTATFSVNLIEGTAPITYQWYYRTSSSGAGNAISGATSATLNITATKEMNNRYYYCTATNLGGTGTSPDAHLTVYYTFTIGEHPNDVKLKKGETGTFSVSIGTAGNPDSYTYQWYIANSLTGNGSRLANATTSSYSVTPNKNIAAEYYYCVINNGQYTVTSNRAKLTADIFAPTITMGTIESNPKINSDATIKVPFIIKESGEGYTETDPVTNFTPEDIVIKVGEVVNSSAIKNLTYTGSNGNEHYYELEVKNITGNGNLSFEVLANAIEDDFGNKSSATPFENYTTIDENGKTNTENIVIDNIAPVISWEKVEGVNEKYANAEDTITITVSILEEIGMDTNEFTSEDIIVNVGGSEANADIVKNVKYVEKDGDEYKYIVTISNVKGEGELSITIPQEKVKDFAKNQNTNTELDKTTGGENVIIDNTKPVIDSLLTKLGDYDSSRDYPTSLESRHQNWSKEDIYVTINATDNGKIDYYMKSEGNTSNFEKVDFKNKISDSVNAIVYYRVVDKAGNYADISKEIKLDKELPNEPVISLFDQRKNGANYVYNASKPTDKSVYVIPLASSITDKGDVQSGIETDVKYTYYTRTMYTDPTKTEQIGETEIFKYDEGMLLTESRYYEFSMTVTDIAGNTITKDGFKVYIAKKAENTIRVSNINDIGSGVKKATIEIYKGDASGNKTTEEAITPIVIEEPYKEIIKNVRLGHGTFYVEVTLEDKVGNTIVLRKTIVNKL